MEYELLSAYFDPHEAMQQETIKLHDEPESWRIEDKDRNLAAVVEQVERDLIQAALDRTGGNISEAARSLGLTRRGLYLKLRRLGFDSRAEVDTR